jgi:hypothetical protein
MYKRLIFLISVLVLFFACASYTSAGIIYVDATDGDLGNTALAAGGVFTSVDVGTTGSGADNLWRWRAFANGGTIFESGGDWAGDGNTEDCPRLVTMVAVPEDDYNVYVYFWCDDTGAQWRIQAALADAAGDLPMYLANDPNGPATVADAGDFEDPVPMLTEGNRTLWQVNLGTTGVTNMISVYVDDEPNHLTGNNRTWYDGIGYESAAEPEPEVPCPVDPGTTCLIADYPLESDLNDVSGNGLNGTFMGDPNAGGPNFVAGHDGMALDLDGIDDYVDCGSDALFDMAGNEMTVAAWVTIRACTNAWQVIAAKGEYAWRLSDYNLEPRFHFGITWWQSADTFGVDGVTAVGYDEWHHVAGTFDGANINVYLDGALDNSEPTTEPIGLNEQPMLIGNNPYDLNRWWDGLIDEVKVYDCALSEYEIMYLAGIQPTPIDPGTAGLIAYYPMENDVSDATGNGHDGVFMGDPNAGDPNFAEGLVCNGMALDLDGTGDYVDCGYDPAFDVTTNEITVSAWVTIRSIANQWAAIAAKGEYAWRLGNASWDPRFHFGITIWNAPDTASLDGVTAVGYDEWHHVAGMFDGANIKVYLDGVLDVSTPTTEPIGINDKNMFIGDNPDATGRYWDGLIDELKIYDRALSECELLYLAECPGPEPECENPVTIENASFELPGDGIWKMALTMLMIPIWRRLRFPAGTATAQWQIPALSQTGPVLPMGSGLPS